MKRIFLDTSFLVHCADWKLDFISEVDRVVQENYEFIVVSPVYDELTALEHERGKLKFTAKLAHAILKSLNTKTISSSKTTADEVILDNIKKDDIVATHDSELKKGLKEKGVNCLIIRQKKYLMIK